MSIICSLDIKITTDRLRDEMRCWSHQYRDAEAEVSKAKFGIQKKTNFVGVWYLLMSVLLMMVYSHWFFIKLRLTGPRVTAVDFRADIIIAVVQRISDCIYILSQNIGCFS